MTTFTEAFRPALDQIRGVPAILGFRDTSVGIRVVTWSGSKPGFGTQTIVDTPIKVASGLYNPRITQISERDAIASGGLYSNQDLKIGPFTPEFDETAFIAAGGVETKTIDPIQTNPVGTAFKEIHYYVQGKGFEQKVWFDRIGDETIPSLRRFVYLRRSGEQRPGGVV